MNVTPVLELLSTTVQALSAPRADTPVVLQDFVAGAADVFGADDAGA